MTLDGYLALPDALSLTALASRIGISKSRLSQLRNSREWPAELAMEVERETGGALNASDLSPVVKMARSGNDRPRRTTVAA